jgi:hypothetical protein
MQRIGIDIDLRLNIGRGKCLPELVLDLRLTLVIIGGDRKIQAGPDLRRQQMRAVRFVGDQEPPWKEAPAPTRSGNAAAVLIMYGPPRQ